MKLSNYLDKLSIKELEKVSSYVESLLSEKEEEVTDEEELAKFIEYVTNDFKEKGYKYHDGVPDSIRILAVIEGLIESLRGDTTYAGTGRLSVEVEDEEADIVKISYIPETIYIDRDFFNEI